MTERGPEADTAAEGTENPPPAPGRARAVGRGFTAGVRATGRGFAGAARATGRTARRASEAEGAGESGLSRLIQMHFFNTAGDSAVAISLAGSLFFQVPSGEARGQVALFLALTMLPFAIVAPLIGPFLDRFAHGRRWAIGATMALRAFLCWGLATSVTGDSPWLFAAALGVLVSSKAYGVTRAAAVPRLLPREFTLVRANGRVSMAGTIGAALSAPVAGLLSLVGPEWSLRYAFALFVIATVCAIRLPEQVDSSTGEDDLVLRGPGAAAGRRGRARVRIPSAVAFALRANCGPRWLSGFLIMFMAFLLRENPPESDLSPEVLVGLIVGAAGAGNALGILLASWLKRINPALHRGARPAGGDRRDRGRHGLLRRAAAHPARAHRRTRAVTGQVLPRRDDPARRPDPRAGQRVRAQRHHPPAGVGDRRLRGHRGATGACAPRPRTGRRRTHALDVLRARQPTSDCLAGPGRAGVSRT